MIRTLELVVVARSGSDRPDAAQPHYRSSATVGRVPVPPEHLFRPGKGATLCDLDVDQNWERFPLLAGRTSHDTCPTCLQNLEALQPPRY